MFYHFWLQFWTQFCIFSTLFRHRFLHRFSHRCLTHLGLHFGALGPPFGAKWAQSGAQSRPSGAKRAKNIDAGPLPWESWNGPVSKSSRKRFQGSSFINLASFWVSFLVVLATSFEASFANSLNSQFSDAASPSRNQKYLTRSNKITERIDKHKPASTTCRNRSQNAEPQNTGAAVSRRMASSIKNELVV